MIRNWGTECKGREGSRKEEGDCQGRMAWAGIWNGFKSDKREVMVSGRQARCMRMRMRSFLDQHSAMDLRLRRDKLL